MPKYLVERYVAGAKNLSPEELRALSKNSSRVLNRMGPHIQWVQSYVTEDKIYCVYIAPGEDAIREHAKQGGFPADQIMRITAVIDPATAEG